MIDALLYLEPFTPALTAYNSLTELEASKVTDEIVSAESPNHISESKGDMLKFRNLCNYSQIKAIGSVLTLDNSPKIKLIHGPPGTALKVLAEKFLVKYSDISKAVIIFSTVSTGASNDLSNILFEVCVVDEASQLVESHTAQVLRPSLKCLVLAGDHKQLSATVLTPHADEHTISSVFVDEVQDLNPSEISLLKFLCPSLTEFVYAGDTCQTIAHGVGFRFETLKDIFFYEYLSNDLNIDCKKRLTPNIWELTQNFRTHNGILFLAKSLVDLIIAFFPNTIDKMNPEFSLNNGPKPLFLESSTTGNLITDLFGYSSKTIVDFGAEQVILVRDEEAKARTLQSCDGKALVLTVLESKGMEFDDVLLLGFFSDSPFKDDWRVIYSKFDHDLSSKKFDKKRHSSLNKELKMLYVLVTRAKYRLIIADDDINARKPILDYWKYNKLIDIHVLDDHIRSFFNSKSGPSEWKEKGNIFMSKKQYENAKYCYHRSGDAELEKLAGAHESEMNGDKIFIVNESKAISHYFSAALEFQNLNEFGESARCYENKCKDYKNAAILYEKISKWGKAASCYEKLESYSLATNFYWKDYDLDNAVRISRT
eukprot:gene17348-22895_t